MPEAANMIAGFGFATDEARPDLSDLDERLARIELPKRYWIELDACAATARRFMAMANSARSKAT
ncbi:MAG TPA: hypothetical protein VE597_02970 [Geminicoccaceae bacterium]|nr:hypothetical protein [Geminicoccaceae bacterium]